MAARPKGSHWQTFSQTATTVSRLTTRCNPTRQKVTGSDVFTACYTGIMASAAVVDAARKDERRKELDRKIETTRDKLALLMDQTTAPDLAQIVDERASRPYQHLEPDTAVDALLRFCKVQPQTLGYRQRMARNRWQIVVKVAPGFSPYLYARKGGRTVGLDQCEELMAREGYSEDRTADHSDWSVRTIEMNNLLVDRLLQAAYEPVKINGVQWSPPALISPDSAWNAIKMLRSEGYPRYINPDLDPEETTRARARLDEVNLRIMVNWVPQLRDKFVGKICFNLLVSVVPPGIENYNALLLGFTRLGEHKLARAVADTFVANPRFKPTQATLLCLLHHYRLSKDLVGFHGLIRRFLGYDARGIGLGQKHIEQVSADPRLQAWAAHYDVAVVGNYLVERPRLDPPHWDAILEGFLDLGLVREAAKVFVACLGRQWAFGMRNFGQLLHTCFATVDHTAAQTVVHGFLHHLESTELAVLSPDALDIRSIKQIRAVLNVALGATKLGTDTGAVPPQTPGPGQSAPLKSLATSLWLREVTYYIGKLEHDLSRVAAWIRGDGEESVEDPLSEAISRLERIERWQHILVHRGERNMKIRRLAQLLWADQMVRSSEKAINKVELDMLNALVETVPSWLEGADGPANVAESVELFEYLRAPDCRAQLVASLFERSSELDDELREALLEALPTPRVSGGKERGAKAVTKRLSLSKALVKVSEYLGSFTPSAEETINPSRLSRMAKLARPWYKSLGLTTPTSI